MGIDVSKEWLDAQIRPAGLSFRVPYTPAGLKRVLKEARRTGVRLAVVEATGKLEERAAEALEEAGTPVAVVNPGRVRDFARASGRLAKTDAIDAAVIAHYAEAMEPRPRTPLTEAEKEAAAMADRRRELVEMIGAEKNRLRSVRVGAVRQLVEKHLRWLEKELGELDGQVTRAVAADPGAQAKKELLKTVPGVGEVTANTLLTGLPELGQAGKKEIASLAGLAPFNRDSGHMRGKRTVYGGRRTVRSALYMAAVTNTRAANELGAYYRRLVEAGKPKKVALIAMARKLLLMINAVLHRQTAWQPTAP
jgi:transposase